MILVFEKSSTSKEICFSDIEKNICSIRVYTGVDDLVGIEGPNKDHIRMI